MSFLDAKKAVAKVRSQPPRRIRLLSSCTPDNLALFLSARFAKENINLNVDVLQFDTLNQHLAAQSDGAEETAFLLPWDLCAAAGWRTGVVTANPTLDDLLTEGKEIMARILDRCSGRVVYLDAEIAPVMSNRDEQARLKGGLLGAAADSGAIVLNADMFSLSSFAASGTPVAGTALASIAEALFRAISDRDERGKGKVLVTDLDNCLWRGVVGEDGPDNVIALESGACFRHFVYQTYLRRLRADGIVLAVASRNDPDLARAPLQRGQMVLSDEDFVLIEAGYGTKSEALKRIADKLNLGLDALVMVDDNPIELAEINSALPEVTTVRFPESEEDIPSLLGTLGNLFHRQVVTDDDKHRHEFYRNRDAASRRFSAAGSVTDFLSGLNMVLTIYERHPETWDRAIQLINKTNQFNLNGRRWTEEQVGALLKCGGRLLTARLADNTGDHGEILAALFSPTGEMEAFVMSCRAFQRQAEFAFLLALKGALPDLLTMKYCETPRNTPFAMFVDDPPFSQNDDGTAVCDIAAFVDAHAGSLDLFDIRFGDAPR